MSEAFFWDGYLHWARTMEQLRYESGQFPGFSQTERPGLYEPLFVRLKEPLAVEVAGALLAKLEDAANSGKLVPLVHNERAFTFLSSFVFAPEDLVIGLKHFLVEQAAKPTEVVPLEFFIYRPLVASKLQHKADEDVFVIIDIGAPALVEQQHSLRLVTFAPPVDRSSAIGAVIDNDIGFLNRQFRLPGEQKTRFAAVWLQSRERLADPAQPTALLDYMVVGCVIAKREIDAMLADPDLDEEAVYLALNQMLHLYEPFRRAPPIDSHGSAVADLAFGQDPGDGPAIPLLAVQLPPEAAVDTSGTYSESYIVQGVRWLCWTARQSSKSSPLVVNISYGALAGAKDGSKFIEEQIRREIELAQLYGQKVSVVFAFGNGLNTRQVARLAVPQGQSSAALTWSIPPDNPVPSFADIRAIHRDAEGNEYLGPVPERLIVKLQGPDGTPSLNYSVVEGEAEPPIQDDPNKGPYDPVQARVYHVPGRMVTGRKDQASYLLAAIGPTAYLADWVPPAPAGDWTMSFENRKGESLDLVIQIQRGDTAPGFGAGGRQSLFKGDFVEKVEDDLLTRDVVAPLTNDGTQSDYAGGSYCPNGDCRILTAGALLEVYGGTVHTDYSSRGASWTSAMAPDEERVVDGLVSYGKPVAGAYSGSRTRLSGTSAAAAMLSRKLVEMGDP
ncbi:MAG TPA: hypothetical protein PLI43_14040 [Albidovulum sp.]|uniref:hypothetical protein n=1 Tax=Albidovulum sp. TaxID=1872424 RepID=UPI002C25C460|nr:hypothetical protein [Albidovulum sp.]